MPLLYVPKGVHPEVANMGEERGLKLASNIAFRWPAQRIGRSRHDLLSHGLAEKVMLSKSLQDTLPSRIQLRHARILFAYGLSHLTLKAQVASHTRSKKQSVKPPIDRENSSIAIRMPPLMEPASSGTQGSDDGTNNFRTLAVQWYPLQATC